MTNIIVLKDEKSIFEIENFYKLKIYDNNDFYNICNLFFDIEEKHRLNYNSYFVYTGFTNITEIIYYIGYFIFSLGFKENLNYNLTINKDELKLKINKAIGDIYDIEFTKKFHFVKKLNFKDKYKKDISKLKHIIVSHFEAITKQYMNLTDFLKESSNLFGYYIDFDYEAFMKNKIKSIRKYIIIPNDIIKEINEKKFYYNNIKFKILSEDEFRKKYKFNRNIIFHNAYGFLFDINIGKFYSNVPINLIFDFIEYEALLHLKGRNKKYYFYFADFIKNSILKFGLIEKIFYKLIGDNYEKTENSYIIKKDIIVNDKKINGTISRDAIQILIHYNWALNDFILFGQNSNKIFQIILLNQIINFNSIIHALNEKYNNINKIKENVNEFLELFLEIFLGNNNNNNNENNFLSA